MSKNKLTTPHLQFFFLCDSIVQREDRQIDVNGLITHFLFTNAPLKMPPSTAAATIVVGIYSQDRFKMYALRVTVQEPDGSEYPLWETKIGFVNEDYSPIKFQTYDLKFLKPDTYWFNAYLNNHLVGQYPLAVDYASMSNS
jgi:hypothetical protein